MTDDEIAGITRRGNRLSLSSNVSIGKACRNDIVLAETMTTANFLITINSNIALVNASASPGGTNKSFFSFSITPAIAPDSEQTNAPHYTYLKEFVHERLSFHLIFPHRKAIHPACQTTTEHHADDMKW